MSNGDGYPHDTVPTEKSALRAHIRRHRAALTDGTDGTGGSSGTERARRDRSLISHLLRELDHRDPQRNAAVAAYCPQHGEPGGLDLPDRIVATGRPVWVPIVESRDQPLRWLPWRGASHATPGAFGILEPSPTPGVTPLSARELLDQVKALIIPALAIGPTGKRLGQGGGFYDRSLAKDAATVANRGKLLAIVDHNEYGIPVPATELDISVPVVVTDAGVFHPREPS